MIEQAFCMVVMIVMGIVVIGGLIVVGLHAHLLCSLFWEEWRR